MIDPTKYSITVKKVSIDGELLFRASVKELPHIAEYGESCAEVYDLVLDAITTLQEMAEEAGQDFPLPSSEESEFSGRVTLRMPKGLHQKISMQADEEQISLNQYLVSVLAFAASAGSAYFRIDSSDALLIGTPKPSPYSRAKAVRQHIYEVQSDVETIVSFSHEENTAPDFTISGRPTWQALRKFKTKVQDEEDVTRPYNQ